jgi:hypothetical protein
MEIITLASEALWFFDYAKRDRDRLHMMLMDEPDLHLHPDLQARFARFMISELEKLRRPPDASKRVRVVMATHSTSLICAVADSQLASIGTKYYGENTVNQRKIDIGFRRTAHFFGHPLSKLINDDQLLIVEGEDDERVWAQAARTARGHIKLYPCLARSVDQQIELERYCQEMLPAIYDAAVAFSLRDGDGKTGPMDPLGVVKRFRLHCYAIENLLLTDECLKAFKSSWKDFCHRAEAWIAQQPARKVVETFSAIITSSDRGRHVTLKNVRTLICHILGSKKPWEVHVGQAVGSLFLNSGQSATTGTHSLSDFIGTEFLKAIGLKI